MESERRSNDTRPTSSTGNVQVKLKRKRRRKVCYFTANSFEFIDYKDIHILKKFTNDRGKITPKRNSGVSAKWQRKLSMAIKRARYIGLLPHCVD